MVTYHPAFPLLRLPSDRIERERRLLAAQDQADRRWNRIVGRTVVKAVAWYCFGLFLIGSAWHTTNSDWAGYLYVAGMYVCALGHTFTTVNFWLRECH
jgi:hypothetical protein